jgi:TPR repeat protein
MGATRTLVGTVLTLALVFCLAAAAWADDVSDGDAAFHNGEYSKAVKLLLPLARQGDAVAQRDVGLMYFGGDGLARDSREAVKWFSLSASQGQIGAQVNLGIAYATGEGVQRNPVQAYVWFNAAASQRTGKSVAARFRDHIATELSPDQLQRAESIATRCRATSYSDCSME